MNPISLIIPYYRNPKMLGLHIEQWSEYAQDMLSHLDIIIIDDHSPEPAYDVLIHAPARVRERISLYRVLDDIPWNQHGARNLGAQQAKTEWLLITDMDRLVLKHDMRRIMQRQLLADRHYKPHGIQMHPIRLRSDDKPPVNQFLCTKTQYWKVGGYDEDYCGLYGGDGVFLKALERIAPLAIMDDVRMIRYSTEFGGDATTTDLERIKGKDSPYQLKQREKQAAGKTTPTNPIRFKWERINL